MDGNEMKDLRELIEFLKANEIAEFDLENDSLKVRLKFQTTAPAAAVPASGIDLTQLAQLMASATAHAPVALPVPAQVTHVHAAEAASAARAETPAAAAAAAPDARLHIVKSPIVGTFYAAPAPGSPTFVKVGDTVENGQILCIVEAMKLMNEIESDAAGEIVEVLVAVGQPVEYGQPLFSLKT